MTESKRSQRTKTVSDGRIEGFLKPLERVVRNADFPCTASIDQTSHMNIFLGGAVKFAAEDGYPTLLHFFVTKNNNANLTKANGILDLTIPIIPIVWNINSRESLNSFIRDAKVPAINAEAYENMPKDESERRIDQYAEKIYNYIKTELAIRYLVAKNHGDKIVMNQIKNMKIMNDCNFDFDIFEAITKGPKTLRHKGGNHYLIFDNNGKEDYVQISDTQAKIYPSYRENLDKYISTRKQFIELKNAIESYKTYDIDEFEQKHTIDSHSLNNVIRGGKVVSPKKVPKQSENSGSQFGE